MIDDNDGPKQTLSVPSFGLKIDLNGHLVSGGLFFLLLLLLHYKQHYQF